MYIVYIAKLKQTPAYISSALHYVCCVEVCITLMTASYLL